MAIEIEGVNVPDTIQTFRINNIDTTYLYPEVTRQADTSKLKINGTNINYLTIDGEKFLHKKVRCGAWRHKIATDTISIPKNHFLQLNKVSSSTLTGLRFVDEDGNVAKSTTINLWVLTESGDKEFIRFTIDGGGNITNYSLISNVIQMRGTRSPAVYTTTQYALVAWSNNDNKYYRLQKQTYGTPVSILNGSCERSIQTTSVGHERISGNLEYPITGDTDEKDGWYDAVPVLVLSGDFYEFTFNLFAAN